MEARIGRREIPDAIQALNGVPGMPGTAISGLAGGGLAKSTKTTAPKDTSFLGPNWKEQLEIIDKASDSLRDFGKAIGGVTGYFYP